MKTVSATPTVTSTAYRAACDADTIRTRRISDAIDARFLATTQEQFDTAMRARHAASAMPTTAQALAALKATGAAA
jgi:hypothetical protein